MQRPRHLCIGNPKATLSIISLIHSQEMYTGSSLNQSLLSCFFYICKYAFVCFCTSVCKEERVTEIHSWSIVIHCQPLSQAKTFAPLRLDITRLHLRAHTQTHTLQGYYSQVQNPSERGAIVNQARLRCKTDVLPLLQPGVIEMQRGWVCMFF